MPFDYQNRVLTYGIVGAVVMRALFIALGETAMSLFHPILLGFAAILLFSSYKLLSEGEGDEDEDLTDNKLIAFASSTLDATDSYDGDKFFTLVNKYVVPVRSLYSLRQCRRNTPFRCSRALRLVEGNAGTNPTLQPTNTAQVCELCRISERSSGRNPTSLNADIR